MKYLNILLFGLIMALLSCRNNDASKQIKIKGTVLDSQTGKPIPNARVTLLCWRKVRNDEETYDKVDTIANSRGAFEVEFVGGFKIDIGSVASNYHPAVQEIKDLSQTSDIKLKLKINAATGTLKNIGQLAVFVRNYNIKPVIPPEYYGINILDGINTPFLDSIDISIESNPRVKYSKVLIASEKGGVVPIFKNTSNVNEAPIEGYTKRYQLNGNEQGFFVRCRDGKTYARIMIFSLEYDRSTPYRNGHLNDYGIMFSIELQTEGHEFNVPNDIRLDYFILENI